MRSLFVGLLLFASTALGQTVTFSGTVIQNNEIAISQALCSTPRAITWTRSNAALCDTLYIWISNGDCTGTPGADDVLLEEVSRTSTTTTGTENLTASSILTLNGSGCDAADVERSFKLCATTRLVDTGNINGNCRSTAESVASNNVTVRYDAKAPAVPGAPEVTGLDKALSVRVSPPADAATLRVQVQALTAGGADGGVDPDGGVGTVGDPILSDEQSTDNPVFRVEGLQNGVVYTVRAQAIDRAGNASAFSEVAQGTPVASRGFFGAYVDAGGEEMGGCGAAGGSLAGGVALAVLGLWLSRRKQS
jgi:hypothetical protein